MAVLPVELRNKLERTIIRARGVAEAGAKATLEALAVHNHEPYSHMSPDERKLRNHLRARARQLGDKQNHKGELEITHLVWECAYEHWHRMLFARFLAENELLIEPDMGVAISLEECEELAKEERKDLWTLASEFAQRMLPQIFRPNDPVLRVMFASEHRLKLENLLNNLEPAIFKASDSLGWVYQFWQSKRKKEVNQSGNKIGADELPAVTQLFTEPYMVSFLLDNSLGAWWTARRLTEADLQNAESENELRRKASLPGVPLEYLRFVKQEDGVWKPAAGTFNGWPKHLSELKTLDPCTGSGHFLVAAFQMLVPMRMELESLSARDACDAVLRDNLHGLEIDKRCVELAVFALALTAWGYPDAGGYRPLPELNVACSGLAITAKKEEWLAMAEDNANLRMTLEELYKQFKDAPIIGSLINPEISLAKGSLFELKWEEVGPLLSKALSGEEDNEIAEMGIVAQGLTKAATMLGSKYELVVTNVPYLGRGGQSEVLINFIDKYYAEGSSDLATAFLMRCLGLCSQTGTASIVCSQYWLFLKSYSDLREKLLKSTKFMGIARLGARAFETISGEVVNVALVTISVAEKKEIKVDCFYGLDVSSQKTANDKSSHLKNDKIRTVQQSSQIKNPDFRVILGDFDRSGKNFGEFVRILQGSSTGDDPKYVRNFWEFQSSLRWKYFQTAPDQGFFSGRNHVWDWPDDDCELANFSGARVQGLDAVGKIGFVISGSQRITHSIYEGLFYSKVLASCRAKNEEHLPAILSFFESGEFERQVRLIDQKNLVTPGNFLKVPFDLDHWTEVAREKYPNGLPKPYSDDPTQWISHGHMAKSYHPLQVAVARMLGYRWPAELDGRMELSDEQREWVSKCDDLLNYVDEDSIVCIPSVRGEEAATGRLRILLSVAFGSDWAPSTEQELIKATGVNASDLNGWLRNHFFEQHCKIFHHRPFIWHIWDGRRRDGFHALVNYHKLAEGNGKGRQLLESLTYSYLGDWIARQKEGIRQGAGGAEDRLAAALELQKRLIAIVEGEPPFDIFVRWKAIEEQSIGWEPDINDGVRLNIRPFMAKDIPGGKKGAGSLRWKPNIKWNKDRGKEPFRPKEQYPWFWKDGEFTGDRVNDIDLTNEKKRHAREKAKKN